MMDPSTSEFTSDVFKSEPGRVAKIMGLAATHPQPWLPQELRAVLVHELDKPVRFDLGALDRGIAAQIRTLAEAEGLVVKSLADLFLHPHPPLELLRLTKDFAKTHQMHPESSLPEEVAQILYYASIAAALARHEMRISQLDNQQLREGFAWASQQAWNDQRLCPLFTEATGRLKA
jgi:hypothetical protein